MVEIEANSKETNTNINVQDLATDVGEIKASTSGLTIESIAARATEEGKDLSESVYILIRG